MGAVEVRMMVTPGLGDNSYVVVSEDEAAVVDPQRDVGEYIAAAVSRGARIRFVLETHVHNDYVSGALELRQATGAEVVGPVGAGYAFPHRPVGEGDKVGLGELTLVAMPTPGHTPEHTSYVVRRGSEALPVAVFTGGSLMVGGAGRTDLLGSERTEELTRAQFASLRRLAQLPDSVEVLPTHGAGSFCGAGPSPAERASTIGQERAWNVGLKAPDEDTFVRQQLSGLLAYPSYYEQMAPINRAGPRLLADLPRPRALRVEDMAGLIAGGAWVIDGRSRWDFAQGHLPGSVSIELEQSFGSYVGWIVPFGQPVALVLPQPEEEALEEALTQLLRIGYERIEGHLAGGIEAWRRAGHDVHSYGTATPAELCARLRSADPPRVLDVRQLVEWDRSHLARSTHLFVGDLPGRVGEISADKEIWAICASGHRSSIAASILDRSGIPVTLVATGGVRQVLADCPELKAEPRR